MLSSLRYRLQRWRYRRDAERSPLASMYDAPAIAAATTMRDTAFLVVDCEMNGLDPSSSQLLSIGWVVIERGRVVNASGRHVLIHSGGQAGESSTIHGLTDSRLAGASTAASALSMLSEEIPGRILVFHHAPLDIAFLQAASREHFRCPLLFSYLDTLEIERLRRSGEPSETGFRLAQCRGRYGLAEVPAHDALADARATAELLLAQIAYLARGWGARLDDLPMRVTP